MLIPLFAGTHVADRPLPGGTGSASRNAVAAILTPADILLDLDVPTKERALEEIARFVGARNGLVSGRIAHVRAG